MNNPKRKKTGRKVSVYISAGMWAEIKKTSIEQDRSISWLLAKAWDGSKTDLMDSRLRLPKVSRGEG